jgi:5-methyltetrahydrofolate--homocysteine methyltransferase
METLEFKQDFEETRKRWNRFWAGRNLDRPIVLATVSKPGVAPPPRPHPYNIPRCNDIEEFASRTVEWAASQDWPGDTVPGYQVTFAADHFALLLGADLEYKGDIGGAESGWVIPCLDDYDADIRFRPDGYWWEQTVAAFRAFRKHADGKMLVSATQLQGGLDALAALRDPQRLLVDLVDCPGDVHDALRRIDRAMDEVRQAVSDELDIPRVGSVTRHGVYSTAYTDVPQCDFSCMIGPDRFREFEIPSLQHECRNLQGATYHLHGPDAVRHLEAVCGVEKIRIIQWQPGAGEAWTRDWSDLYRRIDALGTGQLRAGTRDDIMRMWEDYSERRFLCARLTDVTAREEVEDFLARF